MPFTRVLLTSVCICGFATASAAGAATLNVKPGLWEMTASGKTQGAPPIPDEMLARLTPAQRAQLKARMAAVMAHSAKPHVYKSCVTEKSLQHGFDPGEQGDERCTPTVLSSSSSMMDVRVQCSGPRTRTSGRFHFEAPSPLTMNGTIDMTISEGAHMMHIKRIMHGQWISADCGKYATHE